MTRRSRRELERALADLRNRREDRHTSVGGELTPAEAEQLEEVYQSAIENHPPETVERLEELETEIEQTDDDTPPGELTGAEKRFLGLLFDVDPPT